MEFSSEDLNKVRLKKDGRGIHELPIHLDILTELPELSKLDNFNYGFFGWASTPEGRIIARNKIINYINFMYSMDITCIREVHKEVKHQKVECAILAGFDYDPITGKFQEQVEEMLHCQNKIINRMIVAFLHHNYSPRFSMIMILDQKYSDGMNELLNNASATPDEIDDWMDTGDKLMKQQTRFLAGDESQKLTAALVMKIEEETLGFRPEDIAYKLKDGKPPLGDYDFYKKEENGSPIP